MTDRIRRSIEPGSIPFGERQRLEQTLSQISAARQPLPGATMAQAAPPSLGIPANPLDPLLGGDLTIADDELTSGLPVGPGPGPVTQELPDGRIARLRILALSARTPLLRELARRTLSRLTEEGRNVL